MSANENAQQEGDRSRDIVLGDYSETQLVSRAMFGMRTGHYIGISTSRVFGAGIWAVLTAEAVATGEINCYFL